MKNGCCGIQKQYNWQWNSYKGKSEKIKTAYAQDQILKGITHKQIRNEILGIIQQLS